MCSLRTVFLGNDPWSAVALDALLSASEPVEPVAVLTRIPKPAGRGSRLRPTEVAEAARRRGLPLFEVESVRGGSGLEALRATRPDVLVVVAYGELLPAEVLELPRFGCVNLHFSVLPRWRGAAPVQRAIQAGDTVSGVTIIEMDEGLDTGSVLAKLEVAVEPTDDAGALGTRLAELGGALLARTVAALAAGSLIPEPQSPEGITYASKLTPDDRTVRWTDPSNVIDRRVRAVSPTPGATTSFRGQGLKIVRGEPTPGQGEPGQILGTDPSTGGVDVGTGEGLYRLLDVAPSGKKNMRADAWAHGARFAPGERFDQHLTEGT